MLNTSMNGGAKIRRLLGTALIGAMFLPFLASCQEKDKPKPGSLIPNYARRDGFGCVQGVVLDGFTGQRFDLSTLKEPDGIYVLIRGQKLRAQFHRDDPNLKGEYYICDIPLEITFPIFANITGFLPFESKSSITSTRAMRSGAQAGAISEEVPISDPIVLGNIRIYPKDAGSRSLVINVRETGQAVADAMVDLQPIDSSPSSFSFNGEFLTVYGTRMVPTRKTTGADGVATFASSEIAYGARYKVTVSSPASADFSQVTRTFNLGFDGTSNDRNNWEFNIDLADENQNLAVVACSASSKSWNENGTVTMVLNRPVQLAAGNDQRDSWTAALSGGSNAVLATNTAANNASEQVELSISGDGKIITLSPKSFTTQKKTPNYSALKTDAQNQDVDLVITYTLTGVMLDILDTDGAGKNNIQLSGVTGASTCNSTRFFQEYK